MVIQLPPLVSTRGHLKTKTHAESRAQPSGKDTSTAPKSTMASARRDAYDESRYSVHASDAGTAQPAPNERRDQTTRKTTGSETVKTSTRRDDESRARDPYDSVKTGESTVPPSRSASVRDSTHRSRDTESKQPSTSRTIHESTRTRESHVPPSRNQSVKDSRSHRHSSVRDPYDSVRTGGATSKSRTETAKRTECHPTSRRMETIREDQQESHRKTHRGSSVSKASTAHSSTRQASRFDDRSAVPSRSSTVRESSRSTVRPSEHAQQSRRESHANTYGASERRDEPPSMVSRRDTIREPSRQTIAPYDSRANCSSPTRVVDDLSQLSLNSTWDRESRGGSQSMAMVPHHGVQRAKIPDGCVSRVERLNQKGRERMCDAAIVLNLKTEDDWHAILNIIERGDLKTGELVKFAKWGKQNDIFSDCFASSGKFADRSLFDFGDSDDDLSSDDDDDYRLRRKDRGARYSYYEKITVERVRYRKRK